MNLVMNRKEHFKNEQNKFSEDGFTLFYNCISKTDPETHRVYLRQEALDISLDSS